MSQVKFETDKLNPCQCGFKPTYYSVGYGRTPYSVWCPVCRKQTDRYRSIGGYHDNVINFWNEIAPLKEITQITSPLVYEYAGGYYLWNEVRRAVLDSWGRSEYDHKLYILFQNGKVEGDYRKFMNKND